MEFQSEPDKRTAKTVTVAVLQLPRRQREEIKTIFQDIIRIYVLHARGETGEEIPAR